MIIPQLRNFVRLKSYRNLKWYSTPSHDKILVESCPLPNYDTGCTYCSIPEFPTDKQIDFDSNLNGTKVLPWKHLLILSHGVEDFHEMPSKIEMMPNSLSHEINILKRNLVSPYHPIMVSNASSVDGDIKVKDLETKQDQLVYLYPDNKIIQFNLRDTKEFIQKYLVPPASEMENLEPVYNPFATTSKLVTTRKRRAIKEKVEKTIGEKFKETDIKKDLILVCGHTQRDVRCGLIAPLVLDELRKVLKLENLENEIDIGLISHIGGHAYAGNLIYFPGDTSKEIVWYGRVFPQQVQGIIQETVVKGRIIKDLYRGDL